MRLLRMIGLAILLSFAFCLALRAQSQTGSLEGRVVLAVERTPLQDASVSVVESRTRQSRLVETDQSGHFLVPDLFPGRYEVTISRLDAQTVRLRDVVVRLGAVSSLGEVALLSAPIVMPPVDIVAPRCVIDPRASSAGVSVPDSLFLRLPTPRSIWSLAYLLPQSNPSSFPHLASGVVNNPNVSGGSEFDNAYFVDGVNATDILNAAGAMALPFNFVQEIQLLSGGYEAEYGLAQGGLFNAITHTGTNQIHGQASLFYAGDRLRARQRVGAGEDRRYDSSNYDLGLAIGGPIRRDHLWYYLAYNPVFESHRSRIPGLAPLSDDTRRHLLAGKLSWSPDPRHAAALTVLGDPTERDGLNTVLLPDSVSNPDVVLSRFRTGMLSATVDLHRQAGRWALAGAVSRTKQWSWSEPPGGTTGDVVEITRVDDLVAGIASGGRGTWENRTLYREFGRLSVVFAEGSHAVKTGLEYAVSTQTVDQAMSWLLITEDPDTPYYWVLQTQAGTVQNRVLSSYIQDSWEIGHGIRLNPGLRWEGQFLRATDRTRCSIVDQWAPRLGIVFAPREAVPQSVYLAIGRYYSTIPSYSLSWWFGAGGQVTTAYPQDPLVDPVGGVELSRVTAGQFRVADDLRGQYNDEISIGYDRELSAGLKATIRIMARDVGRVVEDGYVESIGEFAMGNPGYGLLSGIPRARHDYRALQVSLERIHSRRFSYLLSYVLSRNRGNHTGLFATDNPELGWGGNATIQFDWPDQMPNSYGLLPNDRTHVLKASAACSVDTDATVGAALTVSSGTPRSEYGTSSGGSGWNTFVKPRGTSRRTPWTWSLDLRATLGLDALQLSRARLLIDVYNVGNPRKATWYDDLHYNAPADPDGTWPSVNPGYGLVRHYQAPLSARLGVVVEI